MAQIRDLGRTLQQVLGTSTARITAITLDLARMRGRIDAIPPHGAHLVRTLPQLLGTSFPRKTIITFVVAAVGGLALITVLLEISVRNELAKETTDAMIGAIPVPSTSVNPMEAWDALPVPVTKPSYAEPVDPAGDLGAKPSSDNAETLGQTSPSKPVPLPRPRLKSR